MGAFEYSRGSALDVILDDMRSRHSVLVRLVTANGLTPDLQCEVGELRGELFDHASDLSSLNELYSPEEISDTLSFARDSEQYWVAVLQKAGLHPHPFAYDVLRQRQGDPPRRVQGDMLREYRQAH